MGGPESHDNRLRDLISPCQKSIRVDIPPERLLRRTTVDPLSLKTEHPGSGVSNL